MSTQETESNSISIAEAELWKLSRELVDSIDHQDWETYSRLCASDLTAFEPEAMGNLVSGMDFHKFYFDIDGVVQKRSEISDWNVRFLGPCESADAAVVSYIRVVQIASDTQVSSATFEETRVWYRINVGTELNAAWAWKHVHFHRSAPARKFPLE